MTKLISIKSDRYVVLFISNAQLINFPIVCINTDNFSILEEKLYSEFPELKNKNIYFLANGNVIDKSASLEENNIKNDTTILIIEMEDEE